MSSELASISTEAMFVEDEVQNNAQGVHPLVGHRIETVMVVPIRRSDRLLRSTKNLSFPIFHLLTVYQIETVFTILSDKLFDFS